MRERGDWMRWEKFNFEALKPVRWSNLGKHKGIAVTGVILTVIGVLSVPAIIFFADLLTGNTDDMIRLSTMGIMFGSLLLLLIGPSMIAGAWHEARNERLLEFRRKNKDKVTFLPVAQLQVKKGSLFDVRRKGTPQVLVSEYRGSFDVDYSFGNTIREGRRTGYMRLKLPRRLPHMILDAVKNNTILGSNLPVIVKKNQGLSLEGDFDNHYKLYVPKQYEQDALYVFTPDVMSLLIGAGAKYDVEIIEDDLYLYHNKEFDFLDAYEMKQVLWLIEGLGEKIYRRADGYRDDRVDDARTRNLIAEQGQELYRMERASVTFKAMSPRKRNMFVTLIVILSIVLLLAIAMLIIVIKAAQEV